MINTVTVVHMARYMRYDSAYMYLFKPIILRDSFIFVSRSLTISLKMKTHDYWKATGAIKIKMT